MKLEFQKIDKEKEKIEVQQELSYSYYASFRDAIYYHDIRKAEFHPATKTVDGQTIQGLYGKKNGLEDVFIPGDPRALVKSLDDRNKYYAAYIDEIKKGAQFISEQTGINIDQAEEYYTAINFDEKTGKPAVFSSIDKIKESLYPANIVCDEIINAAQEVFRNIEDVKENEKGFMHEWLETGKERTMAALAKLTSLGEKMVNNIQKEKSGLYADDVNLVNDIITTRVLKNIEQRINPENAGSNSLFFMDPYSYNITRDTIDKIDEYVNMYDETFERKLFDYAKQDVVQFKKYLGEYVKGQPKYLDNETALKIYQEVTKPENKEAKPQMIAPYLRTVLGTVHFNQNMTDAQKAELQNTIIKSVCDPEVVNMEPYYIKSAFINLSKDKSAGYDEFNRTIGLSFITREVLEKLVDEKYNEVVGNMLDRIKNEEKIKEDDFYDLARKACVITESELKGRIEITDITGPHDYGVNLSQEQVNALKNIEEVRSALDQTLSLAKEQMDEYKEAGSNAKIPEASDIYGQIEEIISQDNPLRTHGINIAMSAYEDYMQTHGISMRVEEELSQINNTTQESENTQTATKEVETNMEL